MKLLLETLNSGAEYLAKRGVPFREAHGAVGVLRWPFSENDRARAERESEGHVKLVVSQRGEILGAGVVGPRAGELIAFWQLVIAKGMNQCIFDIWCSLK